jgi:hypothetical protein
MIAVRAEKRHVEDAIAWMVKRGMPAPPADMFSPVGFVVEGVAGHWLYLTNSSMAYLEMLTSNPDAPKADRDKALDLVIGRCIHEAKLAGCRVVVTLINRPDLQARAERLGFQIHDPASLATYRTGGL